MADTQTADGISAYKKRECRFWQRGIKIIVMSAVDNCVRCAKIIG